MRRYKLDLHVHTSETSPCGKIAARELVRLYKEAGYDGIVITDHFSPEYLAFIGPLGWRETVDRFFLGYQEAAAKGREIGLAVIPGLELKFCGDVNDYLVYGADRDFLAATSDLLHLGLERLHRLTREKGFLIFQAHPFRPEVRAADPRLLDGVEVYNGNARHSSSNHLAYQFARDNGLRMSSGSDCHQLPDLARGGIILAEEVRTAAQLAEALRDGRIEGLIRAEDPCASA